MLTLSGKIMALRPSKDNTRLFLEVADMEAFNRYQVALPAGGPPLQVGQLVQIQVMSIRAFQSQVSLDGVLMEQPQAAEALKK